jgi:hypothetical protein
MYSAITLASAKMAVGRYKIGSDFNKTFKEFYIPFNGQYASRQ